MLIITELKITLVQRNREEGAVRKKAQIAVHSILEDLIERFEKGELPKSSQE